MAYNFLLIDTSTKNNKRWRELKRERERKRYVKRKSSTNYVINCAYLKLVHMHLPETCT